MRLFLQREKKVNLAGRFGIWSFLCWARGLSVQRRKAELRSMIGRENIEGMVIDLLKKTKRRDLLEPIADIVETELQALPEIHLAFIGHRIDEMFEICDKY